MMKRFKATRWMPGRGLPWVIPILLACLVGCSPQPGQEEAVLDGDLKSPVEAEPSGQYVVEDIEAEPPPPTPCPFASEVKQVVLKHMLERLEGDLAAPASMYFFQDPDHGEQVVTSLGEVGVELVSKPVPMVMQAGIPVTRDGGRPVVLCSVEVGAWTDQEVDATGIWLVDDELEGRDPYRLVRDGASWVIDSGETPEYGE